LQESELWIGSRAVIATVDVVGFHCWPDAPDAVLYLAERHRHVFKIRCEFNVMGEDRDIEFHTAQGWIRAALKNGWGDPCNFGALSCEGIARELNVLLERRPGKDAGRWAQAIEVWEDGENGARVTFTKVLK
jgi:hypothetical protein